MIKRPNRSGYRDVIPSGKKWQARVYVGPGDQRHSSSFDTAEQAAKEVLCFLCTGDPPPTPDKKRNKRGEGSQPQPKRPRRPAGLCPATPLSELPAQPITPATWAAFGVYTAPRFD